MAKRTSKVNKTSASSTEMLFNQQNYVLVGIGVTLIIVGFVIMYLENEIDGFLALYVSPILIMAGFIEIVYAIMKKRPTQEV